MSIELKAVCHKISYIESSVLYAKKAENLWSTLSWQIFKGHYLDTHIQCKAYMSK